jgi:hypothetical protein
LKKMISYAVRTLSLVVSTLVVGTVCASAQQPEKPKADVFAGYSLLAFEAGNGRHDAVNGAGASVTAHFNDWFGITGDVSGHVQGGDGLLYVLGGPRFTYRSAKTRVEPFAHVLAGGAFTADAGRFAMAIGGGIDVRVSDKVAVRAVQADYAPIFSDGRTANNVRIAAGVVFRF